MTTNWFGGPTSPSDPSTFNYDTAAQQVQRQRAAAQALQQLGMGTNQGQIIKGGDFTGFAGGNTIGSTLARVLASALGTKANENADDQQTKLSTDSQDALMYAMDPKNTPAGKRAAAAALLAQNNTVQAGNQVGSSSASQDAPVETFPVDAPSTSVNPMAQAAAQALAPRPNPAPAAPQPQPQPLAAAPAPNPGAIPALAQAQTVSSTPRPMQSVTGGPQSFGMGGLSRVLGPHMDGPASAPAASGSMSPTDIANATNMFSAAPKPMLAAKPTIPGARGSMSPSDIAFASKMLGGSAPPAPVPAANAPTASPAVTGATGQMPAVPMQQPMPQQSQAPMPQPQAPMPAQQPPAPMQQPMPVQAQAPMPQPAQAPTPDDSQPTQAEQIAQLQAISRTGPMGQQMALAQMNNMFASKVGRFKTSVMADPVNGGFLKTTEDSVTGASKSEVIGGGNGTLVTGQTTDEHGNRLNVHKDGSTTPMLDGSGKPVVDSSVIARNDDQTQKVGIAIQSNSTAQAAIDTALARNNRILQLYKTTETGPFMGHMPNITPERQELQALLAQDLFGETRNALAGAGDAGGAPRMAQSEFKYMADNGGLKQTTDAKAAANLIANMNEQLIRQKQALQDYRGTLQTTAPGSASGVPARGQTVSAAQWGFK